MPQTGSEANLLPIILVTGVSLLLNLGLLATVILVVFQSRKTACQAMVTTQEAMDSLLAVADLPAASWREEVRQRSLKKLRDRPVERERKVLH